MDIQKMTLSDLNILSNNLTTDFDDFWNFETLKSELESPYSEFFVVKNQNEIIGFAGIKTVLDEADIMNIVIRKDLRNQKIGSSLLQFILDYLGNYSSVSKINLEVAKDNLPAISLYEKFGFEKISTRPNYYKNKTAIIMQKICK